MCEAISIVMSADSWWGPSHDGWYHSHPSIMQANGLPHSAMGTKYARVEVTPPNGRFRDKKGNVVGSLASFSVKLDEQRKPAWWSDDEPAQIERARLLAKKWLDSHPNNLVPGYSSIGGNGSKLTDGDGSCMCWKTRNGLRVRLHVFYVGDCDIKANTKYELGKGNTPEIVKE